MWIGKKCFFFDYSIFFIHSFFLCLHWWFHCFTYTHTHTSTGSFRYMSRVYYFQQVFLFQNKNKTKKKFWLIQFHSIRGNKPGLFLLHCCYYYSWYKCSILGYYFDLKECSFSYMKKKESYYLTTTTTTKCRLCSKKKNKTGNHRKRVFFFLDFWNPISIPLTHTSKMNKNFFSRRN